MVCHDNYRSSIHCCDYTGTFVDCLGGQWWAHSLNLGYLLPEDHVKSTVSSVFTGNHVDSFNPGIFGYGRTL